MTSKIVWRWTNLKNKQGAVEHWGALRLNGLNPIHMNSFSTTNFCDKLSVTESGQSCCVHEKKVIEENLFV
jgi:hypothetical protein